MTKSKSEDWFNEKYSKEKVISIIGNDNFKLEDSLKIKEFTKLKSFSLEKFELTYLEICSCSQLNNVELLELPKLKSLTVTKCPNLVTLNCSSTELISLEINDCCILKEVDLSRLPKLTNLSVTDCQQLTRLDCSSKELTRLEIINCTQLNKITDSFKSEPKSLCVGGYLDLTSLDCLETGFTSLKINGCSKLNGIDLSKFTEITSLTVIDCSKLTKFDCSSNKLNNLKINGCYTLKEVDLSKLPNLTSLSVIDCLKLEKLNCSSIKTLTELEVSDLIELNCSNTSIEELSLNLCPHITRLICSNNSKLINLYVSNCSNLEFLDCSDSKLISLDLSYCPKSIKVKSPDLDIIREKENIKNILIVGRTGSGRSTLANVLTNSEDFRESEHAVSKTKSFNKKVFKWNMNNFCVVDTVGFEDTNLSTKQVLYKIADGIYSMPEGISQVLFVVDGRFLPEKIKALNLINDVFFESGILDYVTLVRTKFDNFRTKEECDKDIKLMCKENDTIAKIVKSCNGVIHVDNPPMDLVKDDDDDDYENRITVNKNARNRSRKILLNYLENVRSVQKNEHFKLKTWDKLHVNILEYVKNTEGAQKKMDYDPELEAIYNSSKELCLIL
ncbi:hypothetical protein RclHR1_02850006 [Rhizophagus clarus]|uniref:Kinase-like domain-containing protein n=1 Tax=Rhizophagus clarus TaxID=94130 RepID=A0A2Z6R476_9GLOM|nr:hypothetical protein RclHR1_02850006 [Rhizophagus clarus]GES90153.1 kinase-like domain-containing protein [Rhizophagus clarus]